jgi:TatD DNase family protein
MLIDSHCHLNMQEFVDDLPMVVDRARQAGVSLIQTICTRETDIAAILKITETYPEIYASFGVHPHEVEKEGILTTDKIVSYTKHPKIIGIGETGLDYYYEHSKRDLQKQSFINHIRAASLTGLPVIIHSRDADDDMMSILASEMKSNPFPGLIHCFSSSLELAQQALDLGLYISLSGMITFKNATNLRSTVSHIPMDKIFIETDSPYLAPVPMRGKRNEPAFVQYVAATLAEVKSISIEDVLSITERNFRRLFSKAYRTSIC